MQGVYSLRRAGGVYGSRVLDEDIHAVMHTAGGYLQSSVSRAHRDGSTAEAGLSENEFSSGFRVARRGRTGIGKYHAHAGNGLFLFAKAHVDLSHFNGVEPCDWSVALEIG